jgi:ubiquinol-cytochrome c reductase subunit 9
MKPLYNLVFKRTSTYAVGIMAAVFFFERGFDVGSESLFESINKGVSWKNYIIMLIFRQI